MERCLPPRQTRPVGHAINQCLEGKRARYKSCIALRGICLLSDTLRLTLDRICRLRQPFASMPLLSMFLVTVLPSNNSKENVLLNQKQASAKQRRAESGLTLVAKNMTLDSRASTGNHRVNIYQ